MKVENINGKLPQHVALPKASFSTLKSLTSKLPEQQQVLAEAVVTAIFERLDIINQYRDDLGVKQIDLILGRTEDLLCKKLEEFSELEKESVKEILLTALQEIPGITESNTDKNTDDIIENEAVDAQQKGSTLVDGISTAIKGILNEKVEQLKDFINTQAPNSSKSTTDANNENKNAETEQPEKTPSDNKSKSEDKQHEELNNSENQYEDIKIFIQQECEKLKTSVNDTIVKNFSVTSKQLKKDKKKQKQLNLIIDTLRQIKIMTQRVGNFLDDIGQHLMEFFNKNIMKLAKIIAKGIMIIMAPVLAAFWLTIGPPIALISYGIFLIAKAIADNMPALAASIGKAIEIAAQAVPIIASAVPKFFDLLSQIVGLVGKILDFLFTKVWKFVTTELWPFVKNEIWPFIQSFFTWFKDEVYAPILKPLLIWIKDTFIKFYEEIIAPNLKRIIDWFTLTFLPWFEKNVMPVLASVLALAKEFLDAIKPYIKPFVDVVLSTLIDMLTIIKPVAITIAKFLAEVVMDILNGVKAAYEFIRDKLIKPIWSFFTEVLPNFGGWLWKKIKALLPWGDKDKDKIETSTELAAKSLSTIEDYKQENARLEGQIQKLTSEKGVTDMKNQLEEQKKKVEKERAAVIEIDKGSVYNILTIVKKIDSTLVSAIIKLTTALEKFITSIEKKSGSPVAVETQKTTINENTVNHTAVSEVTNTIQTQQHSDIAAIDNSTTKNIEVLNSQIAQEKKQQDLKIETLEVKDSIQQSQQQGSLKEYLSQMFEQVLVKLDEPIAIPLPLGLSLNNNALLENGEI